MTTGRINQVSRLIIGLLRAKRAVSPKAREVVLSPRAATDFLRVSKLSSENRAPLRQHLAELNICYLATLGPPDNTRLSAIRSLQKTFKKETRICIARTVKPSKTQHTFPV